MRSIEVGDSLPGIGQVTGILYQGGRWSIQGTQGNILQ
jgi:intracellular multiplication protein IcmG